MRKWQYNRLGLADNLVVQRTFRQAELTQFRKLAKPVRQSLLARIAELFWR